MTTKQGIIEEIQVVADATENNQTRITFGMPGSTLKNIIDQLQPTGRVWDESEVLGAWPLVIQGLANWLNKVRRVTAHTDLDSKDRTIEIGANAVTVTLPAAATALKGQYVVKALNVTGAAIAGTLDGAAGPSPVAAYEAVRVYCNGTEWLTW